MTAEIRTHRSIEHSLCGEPTSVEAGRAEVRLVTSHPMAVDEHGLVHGGFVFGLADHAAMVAVNEPTVVVARSEAAFRAPVRVGQTLTAIAAVRATEGGAAGEGRSDRPVVDVTVTAAGIEAGATATVLTATFRCAVPPRHVLAGGTAAGAPPAEVPP